MAHRIYISPSLQPANLYADGSGSEQDHMQAVGQRVVELLRQHQEFIVFTNRVGMSMPEAVLESNNLAVHVHVAIHSNAGGGDGTLALHYPGSVQGEKLAKKIYKEVAPLSPGKDDGVRADRDLYELNQTIAPSTIIEVEFHDNKKLAAWIGPHHEEIAQAIYKGICNYFEVSPVKEQISETIEVEVRIGNMVYQGKLKGIVV